MKKAFIFFLWLMPCMLIAEQEVFSVRHNLYIDYRHILVFNNNTIWEAVPLQKNSRTPSEWWNDLDIDQPSDHFFFNINTWNASSCIIINQEKWEGSELANIYRNDQQKLKKCEYLLENIITNEWIFARPVSFEEIIQHFKNHSWQQYRRGYSKGYQAGRSSVSHHHRH